jgi:hypothetical protein
MFEPVVSAVLICERVSTGTPNKDCTVAGGTGLSR